MAQMRGKRHAVRQAKKVLSNCGIDPQKYNVRRTSKNEIDLWMIAERLGINIVERPFEDRISGVFFKSDGILYLGVNELHSEHRKRFTIAHEIGHFILHANAKLHYDTGDDWDAIYFRAENVTNLDETEANHFAAELLMPSELVDKCIEAGINSVKELANRFNVSEDAMRYRLINLGWL